MPVVAMVRGEKVQLRRDLLRDRKGRIPGTQKLGLFPIRIYGFPKDAEEKAFGGSELPLHVSVFGPRAWRYSEVGLCFLSYAFRRGVETEDA